MLSLYDTVSNLQAEYGQGLYTRFFLARGDESVVLFKHDLGGTADRLFPRKLS